jgi:tetrapyrrole methylase family protein/MazG family protein
MDNAMPDKLPDTPPDAPPDKPTSAAKASQMGAVPLTLPALKQAQAISSQAIAEGFSFAELRDVWAQVYSEIAEFEAAEPGTAHAAEELGDILFSLVNVAYVSGIDAEAALLATCNKFRRRWAIMEAHAQKSGKCLRELDIERLEDLWQCAKTQLKGSNELASATGRMENAQIVCLDISDERSSNEHDY